MGERTALARTCDILAQIGNLEQFLTGKTLSDFQSDVILRLAVERALEIISEASKHLPDSIKAGHAEIPWQEVRAIGNLLRHEYQRVDADLIWVTATKDIVPLRLAMEEIRQKLMAAKE